MRKFPACAELHSVEAPSIKSLSLLLVTIFIPEALCLIQFFQVYRSSLALPLQIHELTILILGELLDVLAVH